VKGFLALEGLDHGPVLGALGVEPGLAVTVVADHPQVVLDGVGVAVFDLTGDGVLQVSSK
jgi:hypothetical protein